MSILGNIFGSGKVLDTAVEVIKEFHTSEEDKVKSFVETKKAYHPYKLTQRLIALSFVFVYLFIMMNGLLAYMYGFIDIENIKEAGKYANSMYLGEITLTIMVFYFGDTTIKNFRK